MAVTSDEVGRRRRSLRDLVIGLGYDRKLVVSDYRVITERAGAVQVDLAVFARRPVDMSSAVMVGGVDVRPDQAISAATALAAPITVIAGTAGWELIETSNRTTLELVEYGRRPSDRLSEELRPERLLAAKSYPQQLSLFRVDVRFLANARRSAADRLRNRVVLAKEQLKLAAADNGISLDREPIARLLVDGLTSLFIEDKFQVEHNTDEWWHETQTRFKELARDLSQFDSISEQLYSFVRESLRDGIDYRSLDSVVVSDLYEPRLVEPGDRQEFGIVYTPYELARRVLERVPVETIEPDRRRVLDLACGSGTILLASHDRLADALPGTMPAGRLHSYLLKRLQGWDRDSFAVRLAHLSLTVHGHPLGNGWKIEARDSLEAEAKVRPTIVVGNPPWRGRRSGPLTAERRFRDDAVTPFIRKALSLVPDDGLLGLLLPASWLTAKHSEDARRLLVSRCEILEVWRLPQGMFPPADVRGAVLVARARREGQKQLTHYLSRRVVDVPAAQRLYATGRATRTTLVPVNDETFTLGAESAITRWFQRQGGTPLPVVANIRTGPPKGDGGGGGRSYRWLANTKLMAHFGIVPEVAIKSARYPGDFDRRAGWSPDRLYVTPKLLVTRVIRSNTPWKLKVGFSFDPVIPSNNQHAVTLRPEWLTSNPSMDEADALFALGAVLGSALVCAWLDEVVSTGHIPKELIDKIVLPPRWLDLGPPTRDLVQLVGADAPVEIRAEAARKIDSMVFRLYRTPTSVRRAVLDSLSGSEAREGAVRYGREDADRSYPAAVEVMRRDGCVLGVSDDTVTLWVDGLTPDEGTSIQVPEGLPGAALLPGASFEVACPADDLSGGEFRLHRSSYLDDDGLSFLPQT